MKSAVILVDSKSRDLMGDALIAHHLEALGIRCHLEPLSSWRSCIGAWKPDLILFNHLGAKHLADLSQYCKASGILTGILPNEGIFYVPGGLEFNSRKNFEHIHCDLMLCWNDLHREQLIANKFCQSPEQVISVGVPRFDFYKAPWKRLFQKKIADTDRPVILVNANFPLVGLNDLPPEAVDRFFAPWKDEIPIYADYWNAVRGQKPARDKFLEFVGALLETDKYHLIIRPHPRENPSFYEDWIFALPREKKRHIRLAAKENITELIINCDLEISCENCTTALEAWIAGKPTVSLAFNKHPYFYTPEVAALLPECEDPQEIAGMVAEALANPSQKSYREARQRHMEKWTHRVDGSAAERVAREIHGAIKRRTKEKSIKLAMTDIRRALKLRVARLFNEPSNTSPWLVVLHRLNLERRLTYPKYLTYVKSIRPKESLRARTLIRSVER